MYQIKLDYRNGAVLIPKATMEALGSPSEVSFLYNMEKGIIAIRCGGVIAPAPGKSRRRSIVIPGTALAKHWDDESDCYTIESNRVLLEEFRKAVPNFIDGSVYLLRGDFIGNAVLGFNLSEAEAIDHDLPVEDFSSYQIKRRSSLLPRSWRQETIIL